MGLGEVGERRRGEDVVLDRLHGVPLEHRHVLVTGGVDDDPRPVALENILQPLRVVDVDEAGNEADLPFPGRGGPFLQLPMDLEKARFRPIDQQDPRRTELHQQPADLGTDRSTGTGDHDRLVMHPGGEPRAVRGRRRIGVGDEVAQFHAAHADLGVGLLAARFGDRHAHTDRGAGLADLPQPAAEHAPGADDDIGHTQPLSAGGDLVDAADHSGHGRLGAMSGGIVIEQTRHEIPPPLRRHQLGGGRHPLR